MSHVDELTFIRYLDRQLPADKAAELEKHTQGCAACLRMFEGLKHETALLRKALVGADEPLPAQFEPRPSEELSWTWLTLLGLAGFGLYTLWNWILVPWREGLQSIGVGQQTLVSVLLFRGLLWEGWSTMAERAMQGLMFIILTVVLITLVRWSVRLRRSWTRMMIALAVTLLLPVTASAAVIETDIENYVLPAGEVLSNDLIVMAHTVLIEGIVEGDLISLAQSTTVTGLGSVETSLR
jgi:anti-sigma factor RsiW